jgi:hypothetical protein
VVVLVVVELRVVQPLPQVVPQPLKRRSQLRRRKKRKSRTKIWASVSSTKSFAPEETSRQMGKVKYSICELRLRFA